jgi:hypothetical protein
MQYFRFTLTVTTYAPNIKNFTALTMHTELIRLDNIPSQGIIFVYCTRDDDDDQRFSRRRSKCRENRLTP